jgi:hypothetical protein
VAPSFISRNEPPHRAASSTRSAIQGMAALLLVGFDGG